MNGSKLAWLLPSVSDFENRYFVHIIRGLFAHQDVASVLSFVPLGPNQKQNETQTSHLVPKSIRRIVCRKTTKTEN